MPSDLACAFKFVNWPPGISCKYTSDAGADIPLSKATYCSRTPSQYSLIPRTASISMPVSRSVWRKLSTTDPRHGCDVPPENASIATSTASTPASAAAKIVAPDIPDVSCVWKCIGMPTSSFNALINIFAAAGFSNPAISFNPSMCAPEDLSSFPIFT